MAKSSSWSKLIREQAEKLIINKLWSNNIMRCLRGVFLATRLTIWSDDDDGVGTPKDHIEIFNIKMDCQYLNFTYHNIYIDRLIEAEVVALFSTNGDLEDES